MGMRRPPAVAGASSLPRLQRNALSRHFARADFTPEEVAAVGRRRLLKIDGIGAKGLSVIETWLREHGLDLPGEAGASAVHGRSMASRLARAARLLRAHGYQVEPGQMTVVMQKAD